MLDTFFKDEDGNNEFLLFCEDGVSSTINALLLLAPSLSNCLFYASLGVGL